MLKPEIKKGCLITLDRVGYWCLPLQDEESHIWVRGGELLVVLARNVTTTLGEAAAAAYHQKSGKTIIAPLKVFELVQ